MIILPDRYSYIECYLTLRCNMACPYCINKHTGVERKQRELSAREWILGINNIDTHGLPVTLGGGEPTIHKGFYEIVNGIDNTIILDLLTNGFGFKVDEFIANAPRKRFTREIDSYKSIRISYHPHSMNQDELIERADALINAGFPVGIFGVSHPKNLSFNVEMTEKCSQRGIYFFVRDYLGFWDDRLYGYFKYHSALNGNRKRCQCRIQELLVGPDGNIYRCHRDLYASEQSTGNILSIATEIQDEFRPCDNFGLCNPCDIKLKLGPDLTTSKCSVEIKENE